MRRSPPPDLTPDGRGRRLWREILSRYDPAPREVVMLHELTRSLDRIDEFRAIIDVDGLVVAGSRGQSVAHPLLAEERAHRLIVDRIAKQLDLPATVAPGGTDRITSLASVRARAAARARWARRGMTGAG